MKNGSIFKDALILFAITLVLGFLLSFAKVLTEPAIKKATDEAIKKAFEQVCPGYFSNENITSDVVGASAGYDAHLTDDESVLRVQDAAGLFLGYIVKATSGGYGGDLNLIIGFDKDGKITSVVYANTPSETPGVGMKTTKESFRNTFIGHNIDDVSSVDTITGATVSSTAFKEAVSMACMFADRAKTMDGR